MCYLWQICFNKLCAKIIWWDEKTSKKSQECCSICYANMVNASREAYKRNDIETIVDSKGILW